MELEELLNKLIEKGWRPRGIYTSITAGFGLIRCEEYTSSPHNERKSYRELVSKESGLWQFVCENRMIEKGGLFWESGGSSGEIDLESRVRRQDYEYRIIESALCKEENLEKFLLDNIKIN